MAMNFFDNQNDDQKNPDLKQNQALFCLLGHKETGQKLLVVNTRLN